ncbi:MAG TPA: alpha/beta hydrolase [Gemmatimonadales bacterium]
MVLRVALALGVIYVATVMIAWRYQDRLAFPAPRRTLPPPEALGITDGEPVIVTTEDGLALGGWYLPARNAPARAPALIWFYGNMETVASLAPIIRWLRHPDIALLIVDYRGYGENAGTATEPGLYRDGDAAWRYLAGRPDIDAARIAVYGRSLGSAVALHVAGRHPVAAVVLDSPFSSGRDMADLHYWFFPRFLLRHELDNVERAAALRIPLLVLHGTEDRIAPARMGRAVAAAGHGTLVEIRGAGHNETYDLGAEAYRTGVHAFLDEALR